MSPFPSRFVGAAAVILNERKEVLLVHHTYGHLNWELPGGASEPGESFVETVIREIREEVGAEATADRLTGIYYERATDAHQFVFLCQLATGSVPNPSSDEVSACGYWSLDDLPRPISDFTIRRIEDAISGVQQPLPAEVPPRSWLGLER